jgi:hypothetical protein
VIAWPAVGNPVGDGVTVTVAVGFGLVDPPGVGLVVGCAGTVGNTITIGVGLCVAVGVGEAFDNADATAAGATTKGLNGLREICDEYAAGIASGVALSVTVVAELRADVRVVVALAVVALDPPFPESTR